MWRRQSVQFRTVSISVLVLLAISSALSPPPPWSKTVGVLDQGGDALSADEGAKRTSTDVETVRSCTDVWRRTMNRLTKP